MRLWRVKGSLAIKYRQHFLFGFIGMSGLSKCPKVCRQFSTHIFEVCLSGNAAFASFGEEKARPLSTVIYRLCLLCGYFKRFRKNDCLYALPHIAFRNAAYNSTLMCVIQIAEFVSAPSAHDFQHLILAERPATTICRI